MPSFKFTATGLVAIGLRGDPADDPSKGVTESLRLGNTKHACVPAPCTGPWLRRRAHNAPPRQPLGRSQKRSHEHGTALASPGQVAASSRTACSGRTGWFTEGFDTRDLKEAKALLEELAE